MANTTQIMKLTHNGKTFSVIKHNNDDVNPYWLYLRYYEYNKYCQWTERRKLLVKYANMESVLYYLINCHDFS